MKGSKKEAWERKRPYVYDVGYVASQECRLGGWIIVYDGNERHPDWINKHAYRWIVRHEPSGRECYRSARARALQTMRGVAWAATPSEALLFADGDQLIP